MSLEKTYSWDGLNTKQLYWHKPNYYSIVLAVSELTALLDLRKS